MYGIYIIQDGTTAAFLGNNPDNRLNQCPLAFFGFFDANSDGTLHVKLNQDGDYAWEDVTRGGDRDFDDVVIHVSLNQPPVLNPIDDQTVAAGTALSLVVSATDPDQPANKLTYQIVGDVPAGAAIDPATGNFSWTPTSEQAGQTFTLTIRVTDDGQPSLSDETQFRVEVTAGCIRDWVPTESGGSPEGRGSVVTEACSVVLIEGDSFLVAAQTSFEIPAPPTLSFTYSDLTFDTTTLEFVNDAFEVALVDQDGNPLVTPYTTGRDAFFNISDGLPASYPEGVVVDGQTVTVGLNGLPPSSVATLIARLVNNDDDTTTTVRISHVKLIDSNLPAPTAGLSTSASTAGLHTVSATFASPGQKVTSAWNGQSEATGLATTGQVYATSLLSQSVQPNYASPNADLTIKDLVTDALLYDGQALSVSGNVSATVTNDGTDGVNAPFSVVFFEDRNGNQALDAGVDSILGNAQVTTPLPAGQTIGVIAPLSGHVRSWKT